MPEPIDRNETPRAGLTRINDAEPGAAGHEAGFVPGFESLAATFDNAPDLVCMSHLRWNFVYQRPQHLMSRCARERRVFYFEEPITKPIGAPLLELGMCPSGVCIVVPLLPEGLDEAESIAAQKQLVDELFARCAIRECVLWYYTPMAMPFTRHLNPLAVVYDCMDELSAFRGAPRGMAQNEAELLARADLVFAGGVSLYEAKCGQHPNVHSFPSSIDVEHFTQARVAQPDPEDQSPIPHPRIGYAGVIDERMDMRLLEELARARPEWHLVMVGPVVKLDPSEIAQGENIHYLGAKLYNDLPSYMAGWDVALLPFARNESTRFISPTKTPEYLAAGKPVVSTSIRDVVRTFKSEELVWVADTAGEFAAAIEAILAATPSIQWHEKVDRFLKDNSWGHTWGRMMRLLQSAIEARSSFREAAHWTTASVRDSLPGN